jgi:hypothetical protein
MLILNTKQQPGGAGVEWGQKTKANIRPVFEGRKTTSAAPADSQAHGSYNDTSPTANSRRCSLIA